MSKYESLVRIARYRMIQERGGQSCRLARKKCPCSVPIPGSYHSSGRAAGEFAGHPSGAPPDVARDRNVPETGYTELTRRSRIPRAQEKEGRRSTAIRGRGRRLYVKWIRQRYASSRWIAFPVLPIPRLRPDPARSSHLLGTGSRILAGSLSAKAPVALIASSKSKLIDEFRRRVARK